MLVLIDKYKPQFWWAESGQILKSIGPFLRKRMLEKRVFCAHRPDCPAHDKEQRAQSIQARSAMKMVHFPIWTTVVGRGAGPDFQISQWRQRTTLLIHSA